MKRLAHLAVALTAAAALLTACKRPSDLPDGSVSRTKVDFQAPAAGGNPSAETLYVSNGGRGTLEAPTVAVSYQDGADWLTVTVTSNGEQYAIAVQPITTGLAAGTYRATLTLTWASGSAEPTRVSVTLIVPARTVDPGYQPSVEAVAIDAPRGGGDPAPAAFQVVNAGRGTLPVPSIDVAYAGTVTGWLTTAVAAASGGYTVTAQARVAGIPSGVHHATLTLRAAGAVVPPRTLPVTLTVPLPEVVLSSHDVALVAPAGGLDVVGIVSAANGGGGQLGVPYGTVTYDGGDWDGMLAVSVTGTRAPYQVALVARQATGASKLASGTYTATVQLAAPGAAVADTIRVTLRVPAPQYALSSSDVFFAEYTTCAVPAPQTVTVTNVGGGTLAAPVVTTQAGVDAWLATSVAATGRDSYTITVGLKAFPPAASATTAVMLTDPTGATSALPLRVRFDALQSDISTATATPSPLHIWAQVGMGDPAPRKLSVRTPAGCFSAPTVSVAAADSTDPATWLSVGGVTSAPHRHDVSVLTSVAGLAAGEQRAATLHLDASGRSFDVPVTLTAGTVAAAGALHNTSGPLYWGKTFVPLADGRALALGAGPDEVFDPSTRTWTALSTGHTGRDCRGTLQLDDGRVLLCGGWKHSELAYGSSTCEVWSGSGWSSFGSLSMLRNGVQLAEMPRGRVLVVSYYTDGAGGSQPAEILDLATGRSTPLTGISGRFAVKRPDGSILVAGGSAKKTWLYLPDRDAWVPSGDTASDGAMLALLDGRVMARSVTSPYAVEIWDPQTGVWSKAPSPKSPGGGMTLLSSGKVLTTGGLVTDAAGNQNFGSKELEVFDPAAGTWTVVGALASTRPPQLMTLASGMVLMAGAMGSDGYSLKETFTW